jgi:hypothetical protein
MGGLGKILERKQRNSKKIREKLMVASVKNSWKYIIGFIYNPEFKIQQ